MTREPEWPPLPLGPWKATRDTLHLYTQLVGKVRLALAPREAEWQNVSLSVTSRGLATGPMPYDETLVEIAFDFVRHTLEVTTSGGRSETVALVPALCVADFYGELTAALARAGVTARIWPVSVEMAVPVRCAEDRAHRTYDPEAVHRFWQVLVRVAAVFAEHRAPFRGRHTPLQFFWGSFDFAYGRFSGRAADPPPGAGAMMRFAMDAQEVAAGFWPGDDRFAEPAFYSYAYPKPDGIERAALAPAGAFWSDALGEFLLRYDDVRRAPSPRAALLDFLASTYDAGRALGGWGTATSYT